MILWISVIIWWLLGTSSFIYLQWEGLEVFTWGQLFASIIMGILGPILWVIIGIVIIIQTNFWSKPIFGKRKGEE